MSIAVRLDELEQKTAEFDWAYVLTARDGGTHLVAVTPTWRDGTLVMAVGRSTEANVASHPSITVCFPPRERTGFSLVVDGEATSAEGVLSFRPRTAVLHRPAPPAVDAAPDRKEYDL